MGRLPAGFSGREEFEERVRAWVERSCAEQGVPFKVTDRRVVAQVAELLRTRPGQSRQTGSSRDSSKRL